jgi:hypothetical protein
MFLFFWQKNDIVIVNDFFLCNIGRVQASESVFGPTVPLMDISYCFSRFFPQCCIIDGKMTFTTREKWIRILKRHTLQLRHYTAFLKGKILRLRRNGFSKLLKKSQGKNLE